MNRKAIAIPEVLHKKLIKYCEIKEFKVNITINFFVVMFLKKKPKVKAYKEIENPVNVEIETSLYFQLKKWDQENNFSPNLTLLFRSILNYYLEKEFKNEHR